ncbi:MAG TPA: Uma2 family endonuclease [Terriglobia bacterium]|nr:Uma2 family endonuclease [Terriglobia bacterium]
MATLAETVGTVETTPLVVKLPSSIVEMTDDQFFDFCQVNRDLRIERTAEGEIVIMLPAGFGSGCRNAIITEQLRAWAKRNGTGVAVDSSAGFKLPSGATRSPDAAWILKSRLKPLSIEEREKFLPLCPDFVVELRSPTDRLADLKRKLEEYIDNGARLGWLIDPPGRQVFIYRPARTVEVLDHPETVSGDPELAGFVLDLKGVLEPES